MENPKKKESVDSELARRRVSKFYWLVALGSRAGVLVSPFYELRFFQDSGFRFTLRIARSNPLQVFIGLVS